jgi:NTP pyrophosphatase (non-canonical NTP hydrolase)
MIEKCRIVLEEVLVERIAQDQKWGEQNHIQMIWMGILMEEVGEAAKEINEFHFRPGPIYAKSDLRNQTEDTSDKQRQRIREELIQVAAVAVAARESLDRNYK